MRLAAGTRNPDAPRKRVALIDLDLEAPGLGSLLNAQTGRGVLDFVVDFLAAGEKSIDGIHAAPQFLADADAAQLDVFPAGALDTSFIEKLARLDFFSSDIWSQEDKCNPVEISLKILLYQIRAQINPDYILIDARAGLHDLSGLSLLALSHVDVLFTRASEQAFQGLDLTLHVLGQRKSIDELLCVIVHSMAPEDLSSEEYKNEVKRVRSASYESFCKHIYSIGEDAPDEDAADGHHFPVVVQKVRPLERFNAPLGVEESFFSQSYKDLLKRIVELTKPE